MSVGTETGPFLECASPNSLTATRQRVAVNDMKTDIRSLQPIRARVVGRSCLAFCLLLFLAACQYDPYTSEYTSHRPNDSDLPGEYVATVETRELIRNAHSYPACNPQVILHADHTFEIKDVPDWFITEGDAGTKLVSGSGTWALQQHQEWWALGILFRESTGQSVFKGPFGMDFMLVGEKPPYLVHMTIGDPDMGKAMQFQKQ